ncbi:aspartate aminotransferase family protein [Paenibacillus hexagrammi]|uniref:Acetylornithine aminotransferase n=1 Tax=Paenibacillus hexagrammi TaxID=2908839 RepID=A0ABY3SPC6_9BACL|nr:aspartate aminotransferase family protein [Paenibacillus sp. YPD9-1]UJF34990.1 aspartate aminotransferase family protein [Paenibacillus sp. YPD9-1]
MNPQLQLQCNEELKMAKASILFTANRPEMILERGEGMYVWDTNGRQYLDFVGGWAVTCLGHSPAVLQEALSLQAATLVNTSPAFYNKPMLQFAKLLTDHSCYDKVFFASSGAEANESAVKLARKYGALKLGGAYEIVTTTNSFHGRTLAMMSATGKARWELLFAPKVPGFRHVPFNDLAAILDVVNSNTCAIMLELIQGEGGVHEADIEYVRQLRRFCDERGILLIFDEIQTGLGRTGKLFAYEHYGVEADIMTLAKGIGGGFPLSAMLTKTEFDLFEAGDQGGTYSGQPLAMAAGYAVVSEIIQSDLSTQAQEMGDYLLGKLQESASRHGLLHIRGKGLLLAFDLPFSKGAELVAACLQEGLLVNAPGPSTIRLMPALTVTTEEIDEMLSILFKVLSRMQ